MLNSKSNFPIKNIGMDGRRTPSKLVLDWFFVFVSVLGRFAMNCVFICERRPTSTITSNEPITICSIARRISEAHPIRWRINFAFAKYSSWLRCSSKTNTLPTVNGSYSVVRKGDWMSYRNCNVHLRPSNSNAKMCKWYFAPLLCVQSRCVLTAHVPLQIQFHQMYFKAFKTYFQFYFVTLPTHTPIHICHGHGRRQSITTRTLSLSLPLTVSFVNYF